VHVRVPRPACSSLSAPGDRRGVRIIRLLDGRIVDDIDVPPASDEQEVLGGSTPASRTRTRRSREGAEKAADGPDREPRIMAFALCGRYSECVRGRFPFAETLRDELGALLLAPAVQHLEV
jgi:hypothetical protein